MPWRPRGQVVVGDLFVKWSDAGERVFGYTEVRPNAATHDRDKGRAECVRLAPTGSRPAGVPDEVSVEGVVEEGHGHLLKLFAEVTRGQAVVLHRSPNDRLDHHSELVSRTRIASDLAEHGELLRELIHAALLERIGVQRRHRGRHHTTPSLGVHDAASGMRCRLWP